MSAAHHFGKERRVSGAHENEERVNALGQRKKIYCLIGKTYNLADWNNIYGLIGKTHMLGCAIGKKYTIQVEKRIRF